MARYHQGLLYLFVCLCVLFHIALFIAFVLIFSRELEKRIELKGMGLCRANIKVDCICLIVCVLFVVFVVVVLIF